MPEEIQLKSSHIIINADLAQSVFQGSAAVYVSFKEEHQLLLISPTQNTWFKSLHKAEQKLLKEKDLNGTKSISIREILLDYNLPEENRKLHFEVNAQKKLLKINF